MKIMKLKSTIPNKAITAWTHNEKVLVQENDLVILVEEQESGPSSVHGFSMVFHPKSNKFLSIERDEIIDLDVK
jgi:hypothetical protein